MIAEDQKGHIRVEYRRLTPKYEWIDKKSKRIKSLQPSYYESICIIVRWYDEQLSGFMSFLGPLQGTYYKGILTVIFVYTDDPPFQESVNKLEEMLEMVEFKWNYIIFNENDIIQAKIEMINKYNIDNDV
eukprot:UN32586